MKQCKQNNRIDDYLFNRLSEEKTREFEEHYFNCPECFESLQEKSEMAAVIRNEGDRIFRDLSTGRVSKRAPVFQRLFGLLSARQWAVAAAASLVLVAALSVLPSLKKDAPQFFLDDDMVRGRTITLISDAIPSQLAWMGIGEGIEYKVTITNHSLLWEATTMNNFIPVPEKIKAEMKPGVTYFYQVKAFSPEGTLVAQSSKVQLPPIQK